MLDSQVDLHVATSSGACFSRVRFQQHCEFRTQPGTSADGGAHALYLLKDSEIRMSSLRFTGGKLQHLRHHPCNDNRGFLRRLWPGIGCGAHLGQVVTHERHGLCVWYATSLVAAFVADAE